MVQFNFFRREVVCKVVYYGPPFAGKTTCLEYIHRNTPDDKRGELTTTTVEQDQTLSFDFTPENLGTVGGMQVKFQVFTVPGQVYYNSSRKLVLQGVDGVVFVADSSREKLQENLDSLQNLLENLAEHGINIQEIPLVIMWNKRDIEDAVDLEELERLINSLQVPTIISIATTGEGVLPAFEKLAALILEDINRKAADSAHSADRPKPKAPSSRGPQSTPIRRPASKAPSEISKQADKPVFKKFKKFLDEDKDKDRKKKKTKGAPPKTPRADKSISTPRPTAAPTPPPPPAPARRAAPPPPPPPVAKPAPAPTPEPTPASTARPKPKPAQPAKPPVLPVPTGEKKAPAKPEPTTTVPIGQTKAEKQKLSPATVRDEKSIPDEKPTPIVLEDKITSEVEPEPETKPKAKVEDEKLPLFERSLGEDAGRPGPLERLVAQSVLLMKCIQVTIGLRFILIANAFDSLFKTINSYVDSIFQTWKTLRTIKRRMERSQPDYQIKALAEDFAVLRIHLARLFLFADFHWEKMECPKKEDWSTSTFPLKLAIETRGYLDDTKRDLALVTPAQIEKTVKKSMMDFVIGLIPNPFELIQAMKDVFIIAFVMKYSRVDIERMYMDMVATYQNMLNLLDKEKNHQHLWQLHEYEQAMQENLQYTYQQQEDLEECIEKCRNKIQRLIQMSCNPEPYANPRRWSRRDLLLEMHKKNPNPLCCIELEIWLTGEISNKVTIAKQQYQLRKKYKIMKYLR